MRAAPASPMRWATSSAQLGWRAALLLSRPNANPRLALALGLAAGCAAPPGGLGPGKGAGDTAGALVEDTAEDDDLHAIDDAPDAGCAALGCLRSARSLGRYSRAALAPALAEGVVLDNGYEVLSVEYLTEGGVATATVTLPLDLAADPPAEGHPVVVNAHGTVGLDDPCRLSGTVSGAGLAGLFGGRGAIGVAPDYPGLGGPGLHRYLDARSEGTSVLDAVRAALQLARWRGLRSSGRAAVVGLSQGGHAALSAAALHSRYAPELDLRAFAAAGPASVFEEQWRAGLGVEGPHLVMHALLVWSFAEAAGASRDGIWAEGVSGWIDGHLLERCYWSPSFGSEPLLTDGFPVEAAAVFSPAFLRAYAAGDWSAWPFMAERFAANRVAPWLDLGEQTAPLAIWQGTADATVLAVDTQAMVRALRAGDIDVELHLVEGAGHTDTAFGFLAAPERATAESVAWVQARLAD